MNNLTRAYVLVFCLTLLSLSVSLSKACFGEANPKAGLSICGVSLGGKLDRTATKFTALGFDPTFGLALFKLGKEAATVGEKRGRVVWVSGGRLEKQRRLILQQGDSLEQVLSILGKPSRIGDSGDFHYCFYDDLRLRIQLTKTFAEMPKIYRVESSGIQLVDSGEIRYKYWIAPMPRKKAPSH